MGAAQSSSSVKPEVEVSDDKSSQAFFASRSSAASSSSSPVQFDETLINHLSSTSSTSPDTNSSSQQLPASRQALLDSQIQSKIQSELSKLKAQESQIIKQIESTLEKQNLESKGEQSNLHSQSLKDDLDGLRKKIEGVKKGKKEGEEWNRVTKERESLVQCLRNNESTPLNCADQVQQFKQAVAAIESAFVAAI